MGQEDVDNLVPQTEDDADAILDSIAEPSSSDQFEQVPPPAQEAAKEYAFTVGGKEIKAPIDKIIRWAEMGYDAPNKIGSLQKEIESWKQKETQIKEMEERYGVVDKYARENPQWWQHAQSSYEQQQNQLSENNPLVSTINELKEQLSGLSSFKDQILQEKQQMQAMQDDEAYMKEFEAVRAQHPGIDLVTPDESGKTLEYKILEHAQRNGINKFTTAFRDMMHDDLMKSSEEKAKEKLMSDRVSRTKLGILGASPTPKTRSAEYSKSKSYADLEREALEELGIN